MEYIKLSNGVEMPTLSDDDMVQIAQMNQHDTGTINFGDPQFVKYLIQNYG